MTISVGIGVGITQPRKYNPFVLDNLTVSPALAYSGRKLRKLYAGNCLRVRRSSDNAELDIGFNSSGGLDTVSLLAFVGANSAYVTTWYDQSLSGINMTQAVLLLQPRIVNAGLLETVGSAPGLYFDGVDDVLATGSNPFGGTITNAYVSTALKNVASSTGFLFTLTGSGVAANAWYAFAPYVNNNIYLDCGGASGANRINAAGGLSSEDKVILDFYCSVTDSVQEIYKNGALLVGDSTGHSVPVVSNVTIGLTGAGPANAVIGEMIFFATTFSTSNRKTLEQDQGAYYGVTIA